MPLEWPRAANALSLGLTLDYAYASDPRFGASPVFGWSDQIGAALVSARDRLTVTDSAGNDTDADYKTAPALGMTLSYRL